MLGRTGHRGRRLFPCLGCNISKKLKGEKFCSRKKIVQCRKQLKGGPFCLARYGMLRGKTGKTFLVQFARPNGAIWCNIIL